MTVVRKVQSKINKSVTEAATPVADVALETAESLKDKSVDAEKKGNRRSSDKNDKSETSVVKSEAKVKKVCHFCEAKSEPHYWDAASLRRYLSDRGRIHSRSRTGACAKHQRRVSQEIKRARLLAMLPFTVKL